MLASFWAIYACLLRDTPRDKNTLFNARSHPQQSTVTLYTAVYSCIGIFPPVGCFSTPRHDRVFIGKLGQKQICDFSRYLRFHRVRCARVCIIILCINNLIEQMAVAELYQQAVQCLAVGLDIRRTWMTSAAAEIDRITSVGKQLVSRATYG